MKRNKRENKIITLIGMSGVGKSYWSGKFAELGYKIFHIDDLISETLDKIINTENGDTNVDYGKTKVGSLARWMGFPGDKRYKKNCRVYLNLEEKITSQSLDEALKLDMPCVIDTTGSVIYLNEKIHSKLKKHTKIIYLDVLESKLQEMLETFCKFPKPIIWGDMYSPLKNESEEKTLQRCYKKLLKFRVGKYKKLAYQTIPYLTHRKSKKVNFLMK